MFLLVVLCGTGCVPRATWLPDSSGFVYTSEGAFSPARLILHDLVKGRRVLVDNLRGGCARPAVSPDGKLFAVTRHEAFGFVQVVVYDLKGKEVKRSKGVEFKESGEDAYLYWAPQGDNVLLAYEGGTGIYDLKENSLNYFPKVLAMEIGGTPICPDGKGFFISQPDGFDHLKFGVMNWQGKSQEINAKAVKLRSEADRMIVGNPQYHSSGWDGDVAFVSWSTFGARFDIQKREASTKEIAPSLTADKKVIQQQYEFPGGAIVRLVELKKRSYEKEARRIRARSIEERYRVEFFAPGKKDPEVIVPNAILVQFLPSPDKKLLLLECHIPLDMPPPPIQRHILVIDATGKTVAKTID